MITVTFAGAGGGKTTSMVKAITEQIALLKENRFLCVVTYTNDATSSIRSKLSDEIKIPPNVFIGTIHSFLFRFIFKPHFPNGSAYSIISGISKKEDEIASFISWAKKKIPESDKRKRVINNKWNKRKEEIYKRLDDAKLITNDLLVKKCKVLTSKAKIRKTLSNKLQYIFVDEYQDTYKWLDDIFKDIYKGGKTELAVIGDPNQSIYGFSYGSSENGARRPKAFNDFPLAMMKLSCDSYIENNMNYRSSTEIVALANLFNKSFQQESNNGDFSPVFAICTNDTTRILALFNEKKKSLNLIGNTFFLSTDNKSLLPYVESLDYELEHTKKKCIRTLEKCIAQYIGLNIDNICSGNDISRIQLRSLAITLGKYEELNLETIKSVFKDKFGRDLVYKEQNVETTPVLFLRDKEGSRALTVHKSKGLEAESVLVLFKSNKHLIKSFTDKELMESPTDDALRLVYVAITRAEKFLVIACEENMSEKSKEIIRKHNISFLN